MMLKLTEAEVEITQEKITFYPLGDHRIFSITPVELEQLVDAVEEGLYE